MSNINSALNTFNLVSRIRAAWVQAQNLADRNHPAALIAQGVKHELRDCDFLEEAIQALASKGADYGANGELGGVLVYIPCVTSFRDLEHWVDKVEVEWTEGKCSNWMTLRGLLDAAEGPDFRYFLWEKDAVWVFSSGHTDDTREGVTAYACLELVDEEGRGCRGMAARPSGGANGEVGAAASV